jgi:hypothetical protein
VKSAHRAISAAVTSLSRAPAGLQMMRAGNRRAHREGATSTPRTITLCAGVVDGTAPVEVRILRTRRDNSRNWRVLGRRTSGDRGARGDGNDDVQSGGGADDGLPVDQRCPDARHTTQTCVTGQPPFTAARVRGRRSRSSPSARVDGERALTRRGVCARNSRFSGAREAPHASVVLRLAAQRPERQASNQRHACDTNVQ